VLFDCDGVLVDSDASVASAWSRWAADLGLDAEEVTNLAHGRRAADTVGLFVPEDRREHELARINRYELEDALSVRAVPGALALVGTMAPHQWAVVTSGRTDLAKARLGAAGVAWPPVLVTADDVVRGKPHPEGYLLAAHRLGIAIREVVVLEDAPAGIEAARAAGAGAVVGVGRRAAGAGANIVVADLRSLRWTGAGVEISGGPDRAEQQG
jgi:sugar-phosphatase